MAETKANPAPLGLLGFGLTTVLLNLKNAGFLGGDSMGMILAMGIFYGGIAQIIAGMMEYKNGNTFGTTAFLSYGFFWLTLVGLLLMPSMGLASAVGANAMAAYLAMWGVFTAFMFVGTLKLNTSLQVIFLSLTVLFFLLATGDATNNSSIKTIAGLVGIFCGFSAIYTAAGQVLNEMYKKNLLPL